MTKVSIVPSLLWTAVLGVNIAGCVIGMQSEQNIAVFAFFLGVNATLIATEWLSFLYRRQVAVWEDMFDRAFAIAEEWRAIATASTPPTDTNTEDE